MKKDPESVLHVVNTDVVADPFDIAQFSASAILKLKLPPRDYLLEDMLSTTSRWLINGDTGVGKTLVGLDLAFAVAAGASFLSWNGGRPCRVAYFDGELPAETLQERLAVARELYGDEAADRVTVYTRDLLDRHGIDMLPFDTPEGQEWLWSHLTRHGYALAVFDSIAMLTKTAMDTEEGWRTMSPLVQRISTIKCAQVWLHHTGHDTSRGYGTKTREWNMDTVVHLAKPEDDPESPEIRLEFRKARLRTPKTAHLFAAQTIQRTDTGWTAEKAPKKSGALKKTDRERKRIWFAEALDELAAGVATSPGYTGEPVRKVKLPDIRDWMKRQGHISTEDGKIPARERVAFQRAKEDLKAAGVIAVENETIWRIK